MKLMCAVVLALLVVLPLSAADASFYGLCRLFVAVLPFCPAW